MTHRDELLGDVVDRILAIERPHPLRVAIDGPDAAGKTTMADELAAMLGRRGRPVIRASVDDFGRPRADRYRRGRDSAEGYRLDSFDHPVLVRRLLAPLGPGGDRRYVAAAFDLEADVAVDADQRLAPADAVLLVDGVFLLAPDLRNHWDFSVFLRVSAQACLRRALARDVPRLGDVETVMARYIARYLTAQADYLEHERPLDRADLVIDNETPAAPRLLERSSP